MDPVRLNLGCGDRKRAGWVNVDWDARLGPDVVHDLNIRPYPFADSTAESIAAFHVLEHLDKPFEAMREFHRILKPGGVLHLKVPHFSRGMTHAEHAHGFDVTFPLYFHPGFATSGYYGIDFELRRRELHWLAFFHLMPYWGYRPAVIGLLRGLNAVISALANVSPAFASRIWCFWVGGFDEIEFEFVCRK